MGDTEGPPKCCARVYHQLLALQWHIRGKARSWLDCGGHFVCLPHGSRDMCMIRLRLLALNEYRSGVIDILIGWSIVERQAIWREGFLVAKFIFGWCFWFC